MKVVRFSNWDEAVIESLIHFKREMQGHLETYFPEKIEDYRKFLHPECVFSQDYHWVGFLIYQDDRLVAKAILSQRVQSKTGNLGFIDWINDPLVAAALIKEVEACALEMGLDEIKTPIDMNFFIKYRIKLPGGGHPLFGEPEYPDYYHTLFKHTGFAVIGTWDTYQVNKGHMIRSFAKKRKQLSERKHAFEPELSVRSIKVSHWDKELKIVYELFVKSFSNMSEYEPITYEQFKTVYDDFKYIIHPWYSYIVELRGKAVGFSINYPDPLPILKKIKGKKLGVLSKLWLLARLKTNFKTIMMAYVGKIPGPQGEEIKGVQIKISKKLSARSFIFKEAMVCYQSSDSPSRRPIDKESLLPFSQYVLYGKRLK